MIKPDRQFTDPRVAAIYDIECGWSADRDFYLSLADGERKKIADFGCGTGLLCDAYAGRGHDVTGIDPAGAMLDIARAKPNGAAVNWVRSDAETFKSAERFDLIIMTGHAFQVLRKEEQIKMTFDVFAQHMAPDSVAVFETRNPAIEWCDRWHETRSLDGPFGTVTITRRIIAQYADEIAFETSYDFGDDVVVSRSDLRFLNDQKIRHFLDGSGLEVLSMYGDWEKGLFDSQTSEEMIYTVQLKRSNESIQG